MLSIVSKERAKLLYKTRKPTDQRTKTRLYKKWQEIKSKCTPNTTKYNGTTICKEWEKFEPFKAWYDKNNIDGKKLCWKDRCFSPETCFFSDEKEDVNLSRYETNLELHGAKEFCSTDRFKKSTKETILEKYGVDHISKVKEFKDKSAETYRNRTEEEKLQTIEKKRKTSLERYGVEHPQQLDLVKAKLRQTCLKTYGTEFPQTLDSTKNKTIETNNRKYGYDYHMMAPGFIEKVKKINKERYGCEWYTQTEEYRKISMEFKIQSDDYHTIDGRTIPQIIVDNDLKVSYTTALNYYNEYGDNFVEAMKDTSCTLIERKVKDLLISLNVKFDERKWFNGIYPDFLIQDKIVIECDGLRWHSDSVQKDNNYHVKKKAIYNENGLKSLFFRENEILEKFEIVSSIIKNSLNITNNKFFARKCVIREVDTKEASSFCKENHLMGSGQGRSFGLYIHDELVTIIRTKKKGNGLDISRFCHKLNTSVVGGFSRLIKHVERKINPEFIQTFIDQRYGTGDYLDSLGFSLETLRPSFGWVKNKVIKHRLTFPGNSGYDQGYSKIWDCGQAKWVKLYN